VEICSLPVSVAAFITPERTAEVPDDLELDRMSWFNIQVDRERALIVTMYFRDSGPQLIIKCADARQIYQTIIREGLIEKYDHAAYLGKELMKAELALRLGRSYKRDESLF
jgi:dihydropteroate synthase